MREDEHLAVCAGPSHTIMQRTHAAHVTAHELLELLKKVDMATLETTVEPQKM